MKKTNRTLYVIECLLATLFMLSLFAGIWMSVYADDTSFMFGGIIIAFAIAILAFLLDRGYFFCIRHYDELFVDEMEELNNDCCKTSDDDNK